MSLLNGEALLAPLRRRPALAASLLALALYVWTLAPGSSGATARRSP